MAERQEDYWGKRAAEGKCTAPEMFFSERGTGLWMVKGDRDVLMQIHDTDEARMLTLKGELLLEAFSVDFCYAGEAAEVVGAVSIDDGAPMTNPPTPWFPLAELLGQEAGG